MVKIMKYAEILGDQEMEYLGETMLTLVKTRTIKTDAAGLDMEFKDTTEF